MRRLERKPLARVDIKTIRAHSRRAFGVRAQRAYGALMKRAFELLCADPQRAGVQQREEIPDAHLFHLRHARARGVAPKQARHIIVFTFDDTSITILRVLHDSMDVEHRASDDEPSNSE